MVFEPSDDAGSSDQMRSLMGPGHVDQAIRQAIQMTWLMLPEERRSTSEVERVVRQLVDRALRDFCEDGATFGQGG